MTSNQASTFDATDSKRIGLLVPSSNVVMEVEFYRSLPNDITVHTSHIPRSNQAITPDAMQQTTDNAIGAAASLEQAELDLVVHGHTASSYVGGIEGDIELARKIGEAAGAPGMTAAEAALRCLRSFGARRLWLAAPYPPATTQTAADFMIAHGFEVRSLECLSVDHATKLKKVPLQAIYELGLRAAAQGDADALFFSGTGVHTLGVIGPLERAIGKPVITANLAALWGALDRIGRTDAFRFGESRLIEWQRERAGR
jgi:maleate isomerase